MSSATKRCQTCRADLPLDAFGRKAKTRDGLQPACRTCRSALIGEAIKRKTAEDPAYAARRKAQVQAAGARYAANGYKAQPKVAPVPDPDGALARERAWREANRDRYRAHYKAYAGRRRAQIDATVIYFTPEQLEARLSMFPGCWMCGGPKETVDHVKPLARGGAHVLANLRPACASCNSSKRAQWPFQRAVTA